ncbi:MAG: 3-deoxy-manno-octulosonate cytidylyltransferase [Rickettsiales bacterium]|jgi:3-deoxy-manno-octulosonate cytidylyltransferase (CMP-KDO synthetase)|nr:3-deoxy-manno-octulosonate cytidylyltransferase [Rickettsiales bacterium]
MSKIITLIPTRMKATRLPNKPLLDINGKTLLQRVVENVRNSLDGDVYVAAGDQIIVDACKEYNVPVILTDPALPSGTDRIAVALKQIDPTGEKYDIVVNFQGDNINTNPKVNLPLIEMIKKGDCDIVTCGMIFKTEEASKNPANVKIVMGLRDNEMEGRVLYFTRAADCPFTRDKDKIKNQDLYHHIGIYVYTADALKKMVNLPVGVLEMRESLEQLRALENGMTIKARIITSEEMKLIQNAPADINTKEELEEARKYII